MSEQEHREFMTSLELARRALYARDPKRRAMEEIERQNREASQSGVSGVESIDD